ncbi:MAG: hypothetical protein GY784_17275 [Gammaproteobacteria bacterium]|nr:hypothetical protein [Gammaproteobacteria bacterium]
MKLYRALTNSMLVTLMVVTSPYLLAAETAIKIEADTGVEHKFELARQYHGQCANSDATQFDQIRPYLKAFTDMEEMAATMADPVRFMRLMSVVNDPHTMHVMTRCASEPVMWDTWVKGMADFNKMGRVMAHFMNPNMYFNWMMAPMNPATYQPMAKMANPAYYNKWMTAMMNPTFYQPITSLANPAWYTPRVNWMMNPQSMQPLFGMMNMGALTQVVPVPKQTAE